MKIHTAPRDGDTTLIVSSTRTHHGSEVVPGLTVLWHPQIERIGDRVAIAAGAKGMALSRTTPPFCAPGHEHGTPLHHRCVSRSPLTLTVQADGELRIDLPDTRMQCRLNGETLLDSRIIPAAEIDRGLVLQLGGAIMLCIHWLDAASQPAAHSALVGYSRAMAAIQRTIVRVAAVDAPVLIVGETGTGKELVAQAIHARSARAHAPLVAVNMATLTESLAATDLFGATKGAYTGAANARQGLFAEADGGTLFLDEVGDTPPTIQPMLLRVLETGEYRAVGSPRTQRADVRLIAATDRDLSADSFNQPLRRRLEAFVIALPPLRERREDVGVLLRHFLSAADCPPARIATIPDDLLVALCRYDWPGNVRQLRHVASRIALALASDQPLALGELIDTPTANAAAGIAPSLPLAAYPPAAMAYRAPGSVSEPELLQALERNAWCVRQAATALGVSRPSFYALLDANSLVRRAQDIPLDELQRAVRDAPDRPDLWAAALRTPREALRRRVKALGMLSS